MKVLLCIVLLWQTADEWYANGVRLAGSGQTAEAIDAYRQAFDRAVLGVDESLRPRVAGEWPAAVERAVAAGVADYDERGRLRLVSR